MVYSLLLAVLLHILTTKLKSQAGDHAFNFFLSPSTQILWLDLKIGHLHILSLAACQLGHLDQCPAHSINWNIIV